MEFKTIAFTALLSVHILNIAAQSGLHQQTKKWSKSPTEVSEICISSVPTYLHGYSYAGRVKIGTSEEPIIWSMLLLKKPEHSIKLNTW